MSQGLLAVVVLQATLPTEHETYAVISLVGQHDSERFTSGTASGQTPVYDYECRLRVHQGNTLVVELFTIEHAPIGRGEIQIQAQAWPDSQFDDWVPLHHDGAATGEVFLEMTYYPALPSLSQTNLQRRPSKFVNLAKRPPLLPLPGEPDPSYEVGIPTALRPGVGGSRQTSAALLPTLSAGLAAVSLGPPSRPLASTHLSDPTPSSQLLAPPPPLRRTLPSSPQLDYTSSPLPSYTVSPSPSPSRAPPIPSRPSPPAPPRPARPSHTQSPAVPATLPPPRRGQPENLSPTKRLPTPPPPGPSLAEIAKAARVREQQEALAARIVREKADAAYAATYAAQLAEEEAQAEQAREQRDALMLDKLRREDEAADAERKRKRELEDESMARELEGEGRRLEAEEKRARELEDERLAIALAEQDP